MDSATVRSSIDDIIELYMKDVDVSLIKENLRLTPEERIMKLESYANFILELQDAHKKTSVAAQAAESD